MALSTPYWIDANNQDIAFPDTSLALTEPDGLLAIGGDLSPKRLLTAYSNGIFPWYNEGEPILWWSPNPRAVLFPTQLKISRSLRKTLAKNNVTITIDNTFKEVVNACGEPRKNQPGTWITPDMRTAYYTMHKLGHAHSIECWHNNQLVGGLYGMSIGQVFFGESMFSRKTDSSKLALVHLVHKLQEWGFQLIDCQVRTAHLTSLGAKDIPREQFIQHLYQWCSTPPKPAAWTTNVLHVGQ
ncbi:MAG: leucyl/phenylalanyl-tRNA--protein transferase [Gammaproteobacteria bacterium]|nr:leucyl/phenylalanyl-tRNA--protein transferase [Gammaproteobacteria bacterium]